MNRPKFQNRYAANFEGEPVAYETYEALEGTLRARWTRLLTTAPPEVKYQEESSLRKPADTRLFESERRPVCKKVESVYPAPIQDDGLQEAPPKEQQGGSQAEWLLGLSKTFRKAVDLIDRNMQGRVLQAIAEIVKEPQAVRGDTVKAMSGDFNGYWRYRIGDYRLVYYPDKNTRTITLYDFASRGDVYGG